jgi:molybdenum cofactor synthesis domain-containing protein
MVTSEAHEPGDVRKQIRVGILTVSDRCSAGQREDLSGPAIQAELPENDFVVALYAVVPDEKKLVAETLKRWADQFECDVILTTGGTGFGPRDLTPEATRKVIDRDAPNISQYLLIKGVDVNPAAALSRGTAGVRGCTLIVNLPGSPTAARECTTWLRPLLPHAVDVLRNRENGHPG